MARKYVLFLIAFATFTMVTSAATKYEINVGGIEVTSDNCSNVTGGDISGGTVSYDPESNTLTLNNVTINRYDDSGKYAVHNRKCLNLTIKFVGTCKLFSEKAPALKLQKHTKLNFYSGTSTIRSQTNNTVALDNNTHVSFFGYGNVNFETTSGSADCIKSSGNSSILLYGANITVKSAGGYALSSVEIWTLNIKYTDYDFCNLRIYSNGSKQSVYNCSNLHKGYHVAILEPYEAYYDESKKTICNSSGSPIYNQDILISDQYVARINSGYFPDANFRNYMLSLYPKGYITQADVNSLTGLNVSGKNISNLSGVKYFSKLKNLNCSSNNLTSLDVTSCSALTTLNCSNNQLSSIELPSSLELLYANNNKFTSLSLTDRSALKTLDLSNNPNLTTLNCYNNGLTSLNVNGCPALATLNCNKNKFSVTFSLTGYSALKTLDISNNPNLTTINCYSNALTSLNVSSCSSLYTLNCYNNAITSLNMTGCSALTRLDCSYNQLSLLNNIPYSVQEINCSHNKLTDIDINNSNSLVILNCSYNQMSSFGDLWLCDELVTFDISHNSLTDISDLGFWQKDISYVNVSFNNLTSLGVSSATSLTNLDCSYNKIKSLVVANKTKLTQLNARGNELTSISVNGCSALTSLDCSANKLSSLSVQGCNALRQLMCYFNQINVSGANTLVNSLCTIPAGSQGVLYYCAPGYIYGEDSSYEGNAITAAQVSISRNKRWIPKKFENSSWVDIPTSILGDVNGDGFVTSADVTAVYDVMLGTDNQFASTADVNGDGYVTSADVTAIYDIMLGN